MRVVGVMRVCDEFTDLVHLTMGAMAAFCDKVCFVVDNVTELTVTSAMLACENVAAVEPLASYPWFHRTSITQAYHLANRDTPDWVLFCDQDMLLPYMHLARDIEMATDGGAASILYEYRDCWDTPSRIVSLSQAYWQPHAMLHRGGNPAWTSLGGPGCNVPAGDCRLYWSEYPCRHMGFMTAASRARRSDAPYYRNRHVPWAGAEPVTLPWREDWTLRNWRIAEGGNQ